MTLRMPPWEAERIANVLENEKITEFTGFGEAWASDCAERIKATVKAEKDKRQRTEDEHTKLKTGLREMLRDVQVV